VIAMTIDEIAEVVGGTAHGSATVTAPAFVDTRTPERGGLFVAVVGEHVDGHDYAGAAVEAGAAAVLGSRRLGADVPVVVVDDVVAALGLLARHVLDTIDGVRVLALTGSQGKTGTKDHLAHVLSLDGPTVATAGNFNNEIGVPLTVLRAEWETSSLVVEMGARGVGHLAYLCGVAPPIAAAVVNVGTAHIGEFGSREAIARAKGEIVEALGPEGTAVLNADDPLVAAMATRTRGRVLTFGTAEDADVRVRAVTTDDLERASFELGHRGAWATVHLQGIGRHQVENAAAAGALALAVGLDLDTVAEGLTDARSASPWRMQLTERADGLAVINDAYNANPESTRAALDALAAIGRRGRRTVAVLGEMRELGDSEARAHHDVGAYAAGLGIDLLVTVGDVAEAIAAGARSVAEWQGEVIVTARREEALTRVGQNVAAADVVLVKASRGAALEHVATGLVEALDKVPEEEGR